MGKLLVVGSANFDLVYRVGKLPVPGQTLLAESFETHAGGKGANQAVAAGKLGCDVHFCGCVGKDGHGDVLIESLRNAGVNVDHVRRAGSATGNAAIFVGEDGANMILVAPNANSEVSAEQVREAVRDLNPKVVLAQLEIPPSAVEAAASVSERFVLNPAPARAMPDSLLSNCFAITPNESETFALTGIEPTDESSCCAAADRLLGKGVLNVVITLGSRGCFWKSASGSLVLAPPEVEPVDTTAAGDAFSGALALGIAEGLGWPEALARANAVAALSTTKRGAQPSMPTKEEVLRKMAN